MIERIRELMNGHEADEIEEHSRLAAVRGVTAQLLLATGAGATLEQLAHEQAEEGRQTVPVALTWAPLLLGPLAAAANLEHARRPSERSEAAVRFLTSASIGFGAALFVVDALLNRGDPPRRIAPLAFASAGLLGLLLDKEEHEIEATEHDLERRARIVERLVPRRKAKLDRVVVHV